MEWLLLLFYIELGAVTQNQWIMYEANPRVQESPQYYMETVARAEFFDTLFIEGKVRTRAVHVKDDYQFSPFTDEYTAAAGLRFRRVEIGFRHFCTHPVIPYIWAADKPVIRYEGGYEEVYIRFDALSHKR